MKNLRKIQKEQRKESTFLKQEAQKLVKKKFSSIESIKGILLTGSVARGDAKIEPYGILIDLCIIIEDGASLDLNHIVGKDNQPSIPYHCISLSDKIGFQIKVRTENEIMNIRNSSEPEIFAKQESIILLDRDKFLSNWKKDAFKIDSEYIKKRALNQYHRFCYLTDEYRYNKWSDREDWAQVTQLFNEAVECYCNFLYCINKSFIPRKDWLVYLTHELEVKPKNHEDMLMKMYSSELTRDFNDKKFKIFQDAKKWIEKNLSII